MSSSEEEVAADGTTSPWAPMRNRVFLALWIAALVSNLGTWMHGVGVQWLMTDVSSSAVAVALLQTASALPVFALSLHAGALADVVDRRRLLLFTQTWMLTVAGALAVISWQGPATPAVLLALTAALAIGSALNAPAWSAIVPELVTRDQLPDALVINGMTFTATMAIGPALGGLVVASVGPGAVFALNAASFLGTIVVLQRWKRVATINGLPPEHISSAVRAGMRYLRHAPAMWPVLVRVIVHVLCMSATMALLPLLARDELSTGPGTFGVLLGSMGVGSAMGAFIVPRIRTSVGVDGTVAVAALTAGIGMIVLGNAGSVPIAAAVLVTTGLATMGTMSSFNLAVQRLLPSWVRGRGLAIYMLVFQAAVAFGAVGWGTLAQHTSVRTAIAAAGALMILTAVLPIAVRWLRLASAVGTDAETGRWPAPHITVEPDPDDGPVLVTVAYRITESDVDGFLDAMRRVRTIRRRDGALRWRIYRDLAETDRFVETYVCQSWGEHLRQRSRSTPSDVSAWRTARAFHRIDEPPVAQFHVATRPGQRLRPISIDERVAASGPLDERSVEATTT